MKLLKKYKGYLVIGSAIIAYCCLMFLFNLPCPIKFMTGISCAGCGMSRACISALRFDFIAAFYYHPLWVIIAPAIIALVILLVNGKKRAYNIIFWMVCIAFVAVWLYRMIFMNTEIVVFAPKDGIFPRIARAIKNLFKSQ